MYTISYTDNGDTFYLNHAYLHTLSFGSQDMAWSTDDKAKADLMLFKVCSLNGDAEYAEVTEL